MHTLINHLSIFDISESKSWIIKAFPYNTFTIPYNDVLHFIIVWLSN